MNRERLEAVDPFIAAALHAECERQERSLNLIASENIPSVAVREALASSVLGKYADGYPGRRFYGGCEVIDRIEQAAIDRAKALFGMPHANVQPHSGTPCERPPGAWIPPRHRRHGYPPAPRRHVGI